MHGIMIIEPLGEVKCWPGGGMLLAGQVKDMGQVRAQVGGVVT